MLREKKEMIQYRIQYRIFSAEIRAPVHNYDEISGFQCFDIGTNLSLKITKVIEVGLWMKSDATYG